MQEFMHDLVTQTTTVDFSSFQYDVNPDAIEDMRWIWGTFGLRRPSVQQAQLLPPPVSQALGQLRPKPKS